MDINIDDLSISLKKIICKLENLIEEGDVSKIRALLDDNISWYSENVDFIKYCAMIANNVDGVFEEIDDANFEDKNSWNRDYVYYLQSKQLSNYSLERYFHILEVQNFLDNILSVSAYDLDSVYGDNGPKEEEISVNFILAAGVGLIAVTAIGIHLLRKRKRRK
ncbi:hypothetical protein [Clostridium sp.]|uniref:hypothetical protein n=1 Tax=Clostridium sp. TaxID=1506 RepID=UPI001B663524|nr:hypothetical protein [Clostridium sp.]MBP3917440.1 hypothetical protein [Clostridium sp.]